MPPHRLTNFEIQKYQNEPKFNGVFSRYNLPNKINDGAYVINLDEYSDTGTHWISLYVKNNDITYFDSFGVEHIPKEIKKFIDNKNIIANIFRIQGYDSTLCEYFCIQFINFMFKGKSLIIQIFFHQITLKRMMICIHMYKMESYCVKCKKHTGNINLQVSSTSNSKLMILSKCAICNSKKSKLINKQEAKGLLSKLGIKTPFSKLPILGDILF